jgi:nucleoside-diphosphate kinase
LKDEVMAKEQTLSIIKPDGVSRNIIGKLLSHFESNGLRVVAMKMIHLSKREAEGFYAVHQRRPFFSSFTDYMSSGPIVAQVLEGENAIAKNREVMGATNPEEAAEGTIRKDYALNIEQNTVHGSDAPESAASEIAYFFSDTELVNPS